MSIHKLTPRKVATVKAGTYEDGGGLRLVVSETGARKWILRITIRGKRREMGLGSYPDVGLAEAREKATTYRKMAKEGIDPITSRRTESTAIPTFSNCAARFIKSHRRGWKNKKHARQWVSTLKTYARPVLGGKPMDMIETEDVLKVLSPIWTSKTETAKRVQGRLENVFDYASAHGYRGQVNPARWRGHLDKLLPRPTRVKKVTHHPAMPYDQVPAFMQELRDKKSLSSMALQLLILTATRTSEILKAEWKEVDLNEGVWTIPAERMKVKQAHRVPLASAAIDLLESLPRVEGNPYLFPGLRHGKPLSNMTLLQMMRGMGYGVNCPKGDYVPHGFRSSFRDWTGEVTNYPRDVAEMALAHAIENKVEAAYRRGDLFVKRRRMMDDWAEYLCAGT